MVRSSVRTYRAIVKLNKSISRAFNVVNNSFCERMFIALNSENDLGSDQESDTGKGAGRVLGVDKRSASDFKRLGKDVDV